VRADGIVEEQVTKLFLDQGFDVVDLGAVLEDYGAVELGGVLGEGTAGVVKLAREYQADVAVFGTATVSTVSEQKETFNTFRAGADVELRTVGATNGFVREWLRSEAEADATDRASATQFTLRDAAYKIQRHMLVAAVLTAYTQERWSGVMLTVTGVTGTQWARELRRALASIEGVRRIEVLRDRAGKVVLALDFDGHVVALVDALKALRLGNRRLELREAVQDNLRYALVRPEEVGSRR
jgi:hypothetical protein